MGVWVCIGGCSVRGCGVYEVCVCVYFNVLRIHETN